MFVFPCYSWHSTCYLRLYFVSVVLWKMFIPVSKRLKGMFTCFNSFPLWFVGTFKSNVKKKCFVSLFRFQISSISQAGTLLLLALMCAKKHLKRRNRTYIPFLTSYFYLWSQDVHCPCIHLTVWCKTTVRAVTKDNSTFAPWWSIFILDGSKSDRLYGPLDNA